MIDVTIQATKLFDEQTETFYEVKPCKITLEHSLISISKWESKWHKPFLSQTSDKTHEMLVDYIRCMTISKNVDPKAYYALTQSDISEITKYIEDPMTATTFPRESYKRSRQIVTSEAIYYQMIRLGIPVEFEKWHLKRLLTLIHYCQINDEPKKKMSKSAIYRQNKALNDARRAKYHTKG